MLDIDDFNRVEGTRGSNKRVYLGKILMEHNTYYDGEWMDAKRYGKGR